jgi:uncharacterized spore protein YtfJ
METNRINSTATTPVYRSPIGVIFDKFAKYKDVSLVYGEPIELENKKVLPVAKVDYFVGGGGGYSGESKNSPVAQGEGGGGYISVKPLGVYEITYDKVRFKPAIDLKFILMMITVCTFGLGILLKPCKKK